MNDEQKKLEAAIEEDRLRRLAQLKEDLKDATRDELFTTMLKLADQRAELLYLLQLAHQVSHELGPLEASVSLCLIESFVRDSGMIPRDEAALVKAQVKEDMTLATSLARSLIDTVLETLASQAAGVSRDLH